MSMSNYLEAKILEHVLKNTAYTPPATVYIALFTAAPGETGGGTEVTGGSYARQTVTFGSVSQGADAASISNSADIDFPVATASWGTIVAAAIFDALTEGNMLFYGTLSTNKVIEIDDQFRFLATKFVLNLS